MNASVFIKNRQQSVPVSVRRLRWLVQTLLRDLLWIEEADLAIYIVNAHEMTRINKGFLQHEGSTDVITFDYGTEFRVASSAFHGREPKVETRNPESKTFLHGEIFVCADEAVAQARRFRTTWQSEIVRYVIHGILHLMGHEDVRVADRRKMKREEDRLLKVITALHPPEKIAGKP